MPHLMSNKFISSSLSQTTIAEPSLALALDLKPVTTATELHPSTDAAD